MSTATPPRTERRTAPRFRPAFGTVCRLGPAWPRVGLVWDISETGLCMLLGDPPPAGGELDAVLAADGGEAGVAVRLKVTHVQEVATGDYLLGARFARPLGPGELTPFMDHRPSGGRVVPAKG
jgi:PilZ domain